ncbi:transmembrane protein 14C isoform X1 [Alligator mississippiensis]|uniref:Transmembrane protein 14C n=2 Tax=Alligator TaxID=8495 RepID=A0A151N139_ALLMI|nr:transmembrane protein 14C isoform X1 [Alligator mississippiensis]KYO30458.1 transmembrane protein 14C isoform B [Alligator mississippiensis]
MPTRQPCRCSAPAPPICSSPLAPPGGRARACSRRRECRMAWDWIGFGYAALVASGGITGYIKAGSVPSLAAGLLFGSLAGLGAYQLSQDPKNVWLSLVASGTLTAVMGIRFFNSGKFMPAGLIAGASLLMVGRLGLKMMEKPHDE